ncbi:hypothetical protein LCGC14_2033230 [marine sediment metagenome]|uniref:Uncharacterized protein n=1 Tax=marine sediment metagenome TaxID=412755 RepID=A0A0F9HR11_9ZZZZ
MNIPIIDLAKAEIDKEGLNHFLIGALASLLADLNGWEFAKEKISGLLLEMNFADDAKAVIEECVSDEYWTTIRQMSDAARRPPGQAS